MSFYIDGAQGFMITNNIIKINLYQDWPDSKWKQDQEHGSIDDRGMRIIIASLAMELNTFVSIQQTFKDVLDFLESQGIIRRKTPNG